MISIVPALNNLGNLTVTSGILALTGGGSSSGVFSVGPGSTLRFGGGAHTLTNAVLTGAGSAEITAGTVSLSGSSMTIDVNTLNLSGGTLDNGLLLTVTGILNWSGGTLTGSGPLTITQTLNWSGGTLSGTGASLLAAGAAASISSGNAKIFDGRTLTNRGAVSVVGSGGISFRNGAVFDNQPGATFDIQVDLSISYGGGTAPAFTNSGVVVKSGGGGTTSIALAFNNSGALTITSGILSLGGGGASSGSFTVGAGSTLRFGGGTHTLNGALLGGSGTVQITAGTVNTDGGGATFTGGSTLLFEGGTLGGTGPLTVNGAFIWSGGTVVGSGGLTVYGSLTFSGGGSKTVDGCTLTNYNGASVIGTGPISFRNGAAFNNEAGATLDIQVDANMSYGGGATPVFNNNGSVTKSGGTGSISIAPTFNNLGSLSVTSGIVVLTGGGSSSGVFSVGPGSTLRFGGGAHTLTNAALTGAGTAEIAAGTVSLSGMTVDIALLNFTNGTLVGSGPLTVSSLFNWTNGTLNNTGPLTVTGRFNWSNGTLSGSGPLTITQVLTWSGGTLGGTGATLIGPAASLNISGGSGKTVDARTLTNKGIVRVTGTGGITFQNGAAINNHAGAIFDIQVDANLSRGAGVMPVFNNNSFVTKSGGAGTTSIALLFNNSGVLKAQSGTLSLSNLNNNSGGLVEVALDANLIATTLTNNGELRQTRNVTGWADVSFFNTGGYGGVIINAAGLDLGTTLVTIKGNQDCTPVPNDTVRRCFDIAPANSSGRNATITFYFTASEIPPQASCNTLQGYRQSSSGWQLLTLDARSCSTSPYFVRVKNVKDFSAFVLDNYVPGMPPTGVSISGPLTTSRGLATAFTAMVSPPTTTLPVTYTWQASLQTPIVHVGGVSHTVVFSWTVVGTQAVTVTARNASGPTPVTASQLVAVQNQPPVADAGVEQAVNTLAAVALDGSASYDPDGDYPLSYLWRQTGGPAVAFTPGLSRTTFTAPADPAVLTFTLVVTDSLNAASAPDVVVIAVNPPCIAPSSVTLSGPSNVKVRVGAAFTASSPSSTTLPITYTWQATGQTPIIRRGGITNTVTFTWTVAGDYSVTVRAANACGHVDSIPHKVVVEPDRRYIYLPLVLRKQ